MRVKESRTRKKEGESEEDVDEVASSRRERRRWTWEQSHVGSRKASDVTTMTKKEQQTRKTKLETKKMTSTMTKQE